MEDTIGDLQKEEGGSNISLIMKLKDALGNKVFPKDYISPKYADIVALVLVTQQKNIPEEVLDQIGSEARSNLVIYNEVKKEVRERIGNISLARTLTNAIALSYAETAQEAELVPIQCALAMGIIGPFLINADYDLDKIDLP